MRQALNFVIYQTTPFVQVLHDGSLRWIAISSDNCKEREVLLMDSMFRGQVAHQTKRQICSILNSAEKELRIVVLPVQQQSNAIDCGVFALAFIHYILSEKETLQSKFRHFLNENALTPLSSLKLTIPISKQ